LETKRLQQLRDLFQEFYIWKRDDPACRIMFAIMTVKKMIEVECDFSLHQDKEVQHETRNKKEDS